MSGSNPFRPKQSENSTAQHRSSRIASSSSSFAPDPIFLGQSPTATVAAAQPNTPSSSASAGTTPPPPNNAPDLDDSVTTDDQSTTDPFDEDSDASGDEAKPSQSSVEAPTTASPDDLRRFQAPIRTTPPPASSTRPSTTSVSFTGQTPEPGTNEDAGQGTKPLESEAAATSLVSSKIDSLETDGDSTDGDTQSYTRIKTSVRPVSLGPGIDPRVLASRPGNRDKVPPPPPKSHHGRLISPDLSITPPAPPTPGRAVNRVSFHGSSPGALGSPRVLQADPDYFGVSANQSVPADTLRRSQSQNKRPPTPPMSRRHSQMRRSKSTFSKQASSQLAALPAVGVATTSTPSSPGSRSQTPSLRSRDSRNNSIVSEEVSSTFTSRSENIAPAPSTQSEVSGLGIQSAPRTTSKRASVINQLPPPPPPRRSRGSNQSNDSNRPASIPSEQRVGGAEHYVSNPSNATDILADLSRLQKEVDDLRGHYETRRSQ
ncbi:hypothetical protein BJY04DRAFT_181064 [Aspergillus karnatakaensis]|uniref:uncharacterized protein n=1 Tax=Aspergillus karnatakaensis TaxID=1810916 RepID=UPI003CCCBDFB